MHEPSNDPDVENVSNNKRRATTRLNLEQYLELLLGPKGAASSFDAEESRRRAWHEHAAELTPLVDPGSRPWAWWKYDAPEPRLPREAQTAYLLRCGLLTEKERTRLETAGIHATAHATRNP
ncbi:MAG TPA: hypothetical protein VJN43_20490 [Bryobacteraceae bacterium]|nr:hypothetical protein [Bryobacteraceae bacterium]